MMFEGKKILVTGGTGFVGASLVRRLLAEGAEVHLFVRKDSKTTRIDEVISKLHLHEVNLDDHESVRTALTLVAPAGVFHLAAVNQSYTEHPTLDDLVKTNISSSLHVMTAAAEVVTDFFVNTSSFVEVGEKQHALKEDDLLEPIELYGISRVPATLYAHALGRYHAKPFVTIRVFTPYGAWMQPGKVIYTAITKALLGETIPFTNPEVTRDYIYIDDLVEVYIRAALKAPSLKGSTLNGGSGVAVSLEDVAKVVLAKTHSRSDVSWNNKGALYDGGHWEADTSKVQEMLGWKPAHSFPDGIEKTVEWFQNNKYYWQHR